MPPSSSASTRTAPARYDAVAIALHWLIALCLAALTVAELIRHEWPHGTFMRDGLKALHNPAGTVLLVLILVRIVWWVGFARALPGASSPVEAALARGAKLGLYALMVVLPVSGIVYVFARGRGIDFGLFQIAGPAWMAWGREVASSVKEAHETLAWVLIWLVALHTAAALWHHVVRKDDVLRRMVPKL